MSSSVAGNRSAGTSTETDVESQPASACMRGTESLGDLHELDRVVALGALGDAHAP